MPEHAADERPVVEPYFPAGHGAHDDAPAAEE